ncbi:MAG: hypothetical protein LBS73_01445 [Campylobacteraceae bacterium]|nr:hypothetical protein [Campylobacteraceae bacterium]
MWVQKAKEWIATFASSLAMTGVGVIAGEAPHCHGFGVAVSICVYSSPSLRACDCGVAIQYFAIVVLNKVLKNIPNKIPKTISKTTPSYAPPSAGGELTIKVCWLYQRVFGILSKKNK